MDSKVKKMTKNLLLSCTLAFGCVHAAASSAYDSAAYISAQKKRSCPIAVYDSFKQNETSTPHGVVVVNNIKAYYPNADVYPVEASNDINWDLSTALGTKTPIINVSYCDSRSNLFEIVTILEYYPDAVVVIAIGNSHSKLSCDDGFTHSFNKKFQSVKNRILFVGASEQNNEQETIADYSFEPYRMTSIEGFHERVIMISGDDAGKSGEKGTSAAAPKVCGALASIIDKFNISPAKALEILISTARKGKDHNDWIHGQGFVDLKTYEVVVQTAKESSEINAISDWNFSLTPKDLDKEQYQRSLYDLYYNAAIEEDLYAIFKLGRLRFNGSECIKNLEMAETYFNLVISGCKKKTSLSYYEHSFLSKSYMYLSTIYSQTNLHLSNLYTQLSLTHSTILKDLEDKFYSKESNTFDPEASRLQEIHSRICKIRKECQIAMQNTKKPERIFGFLSLAANAGCVESARKLALMYALGNGTEIDHSQAFQWMKQSAEWGDLEAQCHLMYWFKNGLFAEKDIGKAFAWLKIISERDNEVCDLIEKWKRSDYGMDYFRILVTYFEQFFKKESLISPLLSYGYPAAPSYGYPAAPSYGYPATPSYGYPAAPSYGYPAAPSYGYPAAPSFGYPGYHR